MPDGFSATKFVGMMVDAGEDIRVLDKSAAGKFLASEEFTTAVGEAWGLTRAEILDLSEGNSGAHLREFTN